MSARPSMWFCHECHAEMRPLMVPDPVCASCRSSFVEKIEDPQNDPRDFATTGDVPNHDQGGVDDMLVALQTLLNHGMEPSDHPFHRHPSPSRMTFQFGGSSGRQRQATFTLGSSSPHPDAHPSMSDFLRRDPTPFASDDTHHSRGGQQIHGQLFSQYLMSLLGQTNHPMMPLFMPENGRMGDYVFSQDALDQIITQIMESTNSSRPVPATQEVVENLPQEVLSANSPLLTKDCAVCKDQFQLETEDPEQQVVITLPCKHPFHKDCILPWLKSSGTCPVCRYALVPQPGQQSLPNTNSNTPSSSTSPRPTSNPTRARSQSPAGLAYQPRPISPSGLGYRPRPISPSGLGYQPRPVSPPFSGLGSLASLFGVGNSRHFRRPSSSSVSRNSPAQPSSPREQTSSTPGSGPRSDQSRSQQDRHPRFPGQWNDDVADLD